MMVDTKNLVPMTEANQNFSKVVRMVDESGLAVILKNNKTAISWWILGSMSSFRLFGIFGSSGSTKRPTGFWMKIWRLFRSLPNDAAHC